MWLQVEEFGRNPETSGDRRDKLLRELGGGRGARRWETRRQRRRRAGRCQCLTRAGRDRVFAPRAPSRRLARCLYQCSLDVTSTADRLPGSHSAPLRHGLHQRALCRREGVHLHQHRVRGENTLFMNVSSGYIHPS